jgi:ribosomal protein S27AE
LAFRGGLDTSGQLAMTRYLLSCPQCGVEIPVTTGQAGDRVSCGGCHAAVAVPRLGDLARLPRAADGSGERGSQGRWSPAHACLWTGLVIAGLSTAVALALQSPPKPAIDEAGIRTAFRAGSIVDVHQAWDGFYRHGVARPPTVEEQAALQRSQAQRAVARVIWVAALAGIGLAAGGAVALAFRRRGVAVDGPSTTAA